MTFTSKIPSYNFTFSRRKNQIDEIASKNRTWSWGRMEKSGFAIFEKVKGAFELRTTIYKNRERKNSLEKIWV